MECNRDDAIRAIQIAERKLTDKEYLSAKKFAIKAQCLFPGLDNISQILTILDVFIASDNKINGESDWYGILGVTPSSDFETLRKGYRRLALALHPDKNKSLGADEAFKLVSEAWSLLSDTPKRLAYNQRRVTKTFQQKGPFRANDFHHSKNMSTSNSKTRVDWNPGSSQSYRKTDTFWTICHHCRTQYEYLRMYLDNTLLCPSCQKPFMASESGQPPNIPSSFHPSSRRHIPSSNHHVATNKNMKGNNTSMKMGTGLPAKVPSLYRDNLHHEDKMRSNDDITKGYGGNNVYGSSNAYGSRNYNSRVETTFRFSVDNKFRELLPYETRKMLMDKALTVIKQGIQQQGSEIEIKANDKEKGKEKKRDDPDRENGNNYAEKGYESKNSLPRSEIDTEKDFVEPIPMNVLDSDFHNFDMDRTETSFDENQVWAAYDEDDGMPRYYALIHKIISVNPFKIKMSWLNSKTNNEFSSLNWVASGFPKSCGIFRIGKHEVYKSLNTFSHKVDFRKGARGALEIYPKKGDIWAVYRNWSSKWNESTLDDVIHKYDMVEVLDDYDEEHGIFVSPLIKKFGFRAVFYRNNTEITKIPKEEMFRFSHQVPKYLIIGHEAPNAPKDCWELDPASTPTELLEVLSDAGFVDDSAKNQESES